MSINGDKFLTEKDEATAEKNQTMRIGQLKAGLLFDEKRYEYKEDFVPGDVRGKNPLDLHTTQELIEHLKHNPHAQVEARILGAREDGTKALLKMNREGFLEASKQRNSKKLREAGNRFREDWDDFDGGGNNGWAGGGGTIGRDFTPLLGGPFDKQLYYRDYLRMIATSFFAYHHDPVARCLVGIMTDFTIGRGFQLHTENKAAQLLWNAFSEVNDLHTQIEHMAQEISAYGEIMWWKLPNNNARISFNPTAGEKVPKAALPRIRLLDPSNIAEIITVPEDPIRGVIAYVWMAPTQYQMFTAKNQPSSKYIYTQIPADQIMHVKVNAMSNEKRGRSDYFPALGYMKRLRDSVNYSIVAQQKAAAWCIDTTIKGNQQDIDDYVSNQQALGAVPTAGSEFVHTEAVQRNYLSNNAGRTGESPAFDWCLNMICMGYGVPVAYLGTHQAGAGNRAAALVSTEPVAKKFERRRLVYDRSIRAIFNWLMGQFNLTAECEIIFPELITQDRSAKLKDLGLSQSQGWIAPSRAADLAAKEFDIKDFKYELEMSQIKKDDKALGISLDPGQTDPLTAPGQSGQTSGVKASGLPGAEKNNIKKNLGTL